MGYGIVNLFIGIPIAGIIEIIVGVCIVTVNLFILLRRKRYTFPAIMINGISVILSIYLFITGGLYHTGIFWCLAFLGLYISTRGLKRGNIWIGTQFGTLLILYLLSLPGIVTIAYSNGEVLAGLIVYSFISYILISYELNRNRYRMEIYRLNSLLPICSYCKKIRDDKGVWRSVDTFLNREANIDFSHGVCPDCLKKHYPVISDRVRKDSDS